MLPCVCSVIDHRLCQNVVRTKKRRQPSVSLMFLPHFNVLCDLLLSIRIYLVYTIKKNMQLQLFISKSFSVTQKPAFAHFGKHEKKPFDVICCLYKMKQSRWLLCITRNCDWSRKITPLSNLTQMPTRGMKTYNETRIELRNLQM